MKLKTLNYRLLHQRLKNYWCEFDWKQIYSNFNQFRSNSHSQLSKPKEKWTLMLKLRKHHFDYWPIPNNWCNHPKHARELVPGLVNDTAKGDSLFLQHNFYRYRKEQKSDA